MASRGVGVYVLGSLQALAESWERGREGGRGGGEGCKGKGGTNEGKEEGKKGKLCKGESQKMI